MTGVDLPADEAAAGKPVFEEIPELYLKRSRDIAVKGRPGQIRETKKKQFRILKSWFGDGKRDKDDQTGVSGKTRKRHSDLASETIGRPFHISGSSGFPRGGSSAGKLRSGFLTGTGRTEEIPFRPLKEDK